MIASSANPVLVGSGIVIALVGVVVLTIGRRRAHRAADLQSALERTSAELAARVDMLQTRSDEQALILESMEDAVLLSDERDIVYANPSASHIFGAPLRTLPPTIPLPVDGDAIVREVSLHHPQRRELRVAVTRVAGRRILVVAQDETEARRIDQTRRDFVANASHEMKTPVAAILATAETLQDAISEDPHAAERFSATLVREAQRLSALVQDLLSLARLEQPLDAREPVRFSMLVTVLCEEARPRCARRKLGFSDDIAPDLVVRGRAEDLSLLARNLLDNAIRYTQPGGSVRVSLHEGDGRAVLEVADTGAGIPQKDLPRIFERFFRVDQARSRETGGTGLGLAIVRHVAESHGGTVTAESELGKGSTFTVSLPLV